MGGDRLKYDSDADVKELADGSFECSSCGKSMDTIGNMRQHVAKHRDLKRKNSKQERKKKKNKKNNNTNKTIEKRQNKNKNKNKSDNRNKLKKTGKKDKKYQSGEDENSGQDESENGNNRNGNKSRSKSDGDYFCDCGSSYISNNLCNIYKNELNKNDKCLGISCDGYNCDCMIKIDEYCYYCKECGDIICVECQTLRNEFMELAHLLKNSANLDDKNIVCVYFYKESDNNNNNHNNNNNSNNLNEKRNGEFTKIANMRDLNKYALEYGIISDSNVYFTVCLYKLLNSGEEYALKPHSYFMNIDINLFTSPITISAKVNSIDEKNDRINECNNDNNNCSDNNYCNNNKNDFDFFKEPPKKRQRLSKMSYLRTQNTNKSKSESESESKSNNSDNTSDNSNSRWNVHKIHKDKHVVEIRNDFNKRKEKQKEKENENKNENNSNDKEKENGSGKNDWQCIRCKIYNSNTFHFCPMCGKSAAMMLTQVQREKEKEKAKEQRKEKEKEKEKEQEREPNFDMFTNMGIDEKSAKRLFSQYGNDIDAALDEYFGTR